MFSRFTFRMSKWTYDELACTKPSKKKTHHRWVDYLTFELIYDPTDDSKPYCLLCCTYLCNCSIHEVRKVGRHLRTLRSKFTEKPLEYYRLLKEQKLKARQELPCRNSHRPAWMNTDSMLVVNFLLRSLDHSLTGKSFWSQSVTMYLRTVQNKFDWELAMLPPSVMTLFTTARTELLMISQHNWLQSSKDKNFHYSWMRQQFESVKLFFWHVLGSSTVQASLFFFFHSPPVCKTCIVWLRNAGLKIVFHKIMLYPLLWISAPTMMGQHKGVLRLLKDDNPDVLTVHWTFHSQREFGSKD